MTGLAEIHASVGRNDGHAGNEVQRRLRLGHQEVYFSYESGSLQHFRQIWTEEHGEFPQYACNLPCLGEVQFADVVLEFQDLSGLDITCFSCGRFVVHEAGKFALGGGADGYEVLAVAHGHRSVGVGYSCILRLLEDCCGAPGYGGFLLPYALAYVGELIGGVVLDVSVAVEYQVDTLENYRKVEYRSAESLEVGVDAVFDAGKEAGYAPYGVKQCAEFAKAKSINAAAFALQRLQEGSAVDETGSGEVLLKEKYQAHFVSEGEALAYGSRRGGELLLRHPGCGIVRAALFGDYFSDFVEAQFGFKPFIGHCSEV